MAQRHRIVQKGVLDMASICISGSVSPSVFTAAPSPARAATRERAGVDIRAMLSAAVANVFISFLAAIVLVFAVILS
jgi:hypothetical protein